MEDPSIEIARLLAAQARRHHEQTVETFAGLRHYTEREVSAISDKVTRIYDEVSAHLKALLQLRERVGGKSGVSFGQGGRSLDAVLSHLFEAVPAMLASIERQASAQAQLALGAQSSAARIQALASETQKLSESTKLLAINARIEAAHAGAAGRGFGVVSDTLKELATIVRGTNQSIWDLGSSISEALTKLGEASGRLVDSSRRHSGLEHELDEGREAFDRTQGEICQFLSEMAEHCDSVRVCADEVLIGLQFEDRLQQNLALVQTRSAQQVDALDYLVEQLTRRPREEMAAILSEVRALMDQEPPNASVDVAKAEVSEGGEITFF